MENIEYSNNTPDYSQDYSEINPANEQRNEHQREAICKRCGVIWHPRNTDTRRPKRCPYCQSHRTEWLDLHPELLEGKDEVENQDDEWNDPDYSSEESMDDTGISQDDTDDVDEEESEDDSGEDYTRINPGINPDYSGDYSIQKKQAAGVPRATVYLLLGAMLIYGLIRVWKKLSKPAPRKETPVSTPQAVSLDRPNMGLAELAMKQHHLL